MAEAPSNPQQPDNGQNGNNPDPNTTSTVQFDPKQSVEMSIDEAAFAAIERDFHEVLQSIIGDTQLEKF